MDKLGGPCSESLEYINESDCLVFPFNDYLSFVPNMVINRKALFGFVCSSITGSNYSLPYLATHCKRSIVPLLCPSLNIIFIPDTSSALTLHVHTASRIPQIPSCFYTNIHHSQ